jgi:GNAT superfamily N-acetyltransferase
MLDYNLVTSKASYKVATERDVAVLSRLVKAFYAETPYGRRSEGVMEATVRELSRHKEKGTVFVFEKGEDVVGYAIIINCWSNELGGTILMLDELYVVPGERSGGIAGDFIDLLAKVAPKDVVAMQLEADASNRRLARFYKKHGFEAVKCLVMTRPLPGRAV